MKSITGIWIDHRKAVVVIISDDGEKMQEVLSNVEKQQGRINRLRSTESFEPQKVEADDHQERAYKGHMELYYKRVTEVIKYSESIFIMGPGEAKDEFKKHLKGERLDTRIIALETVDKMTEPQIVEKVRNYFQGHRI